MIEPFMPTEAENYDVLIQFGQVNKREIDNPIRYEYFSATDDEFYLDVKEIAHYEIRGGHTITLELYENAKFGLVTLYLLGSAFGALLFQRGIVPIHGSAIAIHGGCAIFTGDSGAGKSTISSTLRGARYKVLTDDVAAVIMDENGIIVHSGYPQHKLWKDSLEYLSKETIGLEPIADRCDKYYVSFREDFQAEPLPLIGLFELLPAVVEDTTIERINHLECLNLLVKNTYRLQFVEGLPRHKTLFQQWGMIMKSTPMYRITRPYNKFTVEDQIALVLEALKANNK